MVLLEPDAFLTQLTRALEKARASGTVYVTFKRGAQRTPRPLAASSPAPSAQHALLAVCCAVTPGKKAGSPSADPAEHRCLARMVGGKKKFSAMIKPSNYQRFMQSYGNILKVSLDSLKKREKKKTDKKAGSSSGAKGVVS